MKYEHCPHYKNGQTCLFHDMPEDCMCPDTCIWRNRSPKKQEKPKRDRTLDVLAFCSRSFGEFAGDSYDDDFLRMTDFF